MSDDVITQATQLRNLIKQLRIWSADPAVKTKAAQIESRAERLLRDLENRFERPAPLVPSYKSEWE
jgi:hypothetical protein